jgi:NADPH-dependent curcumin reductase CurA
MANINRQVVLTELPSGALTEDLFELRDGPMPEPADGEVLCRTLLLSIDAANRAWMQGATYREAISGGDIMAGFALAQVVRSRSNAFAPGDIVEADAGWQDFSVHPARSLTKVNVRAPLSTHMSAIGITGLTAYFGLLRVGRPVAGETVLVSAAAGATGNVVGQLAKSAGCRVVGVVGRTDKADFLLGELGFDAVISHRDPDFRGALKAACPHGIDIYFDNTGGPVLEATMFRMNVHGRIVCCGVVSQYDTSTPSPGPRGVPGLLVTKRIRMEGFLVMDFFADRRSAEDELLAAIEAGRLKVVVDTAEGLERAPHALVGLLAGDNIGKRLVHIADATN